MTRSARHLDRRGGGLKTTTEQTILVFRAAQEARGIPMEVVKLLEKQGIGGAAQPPGLYAYRFLLDSDNSGQTLAAEDWRNGFSVRCIREVD